MVYTLCAVPLAVLTFLCSVTWTCVLCNENKCPSLCVCLDIYVDCSQRNLNDVPPGLPGYTEKLDLSSNKLAQVGPILLQKLFELDLHKNLLTSLPILTGLTQLRILKIASNSITTLSLDALAALPRLQVLDLSSNRLAHLNAHVFPPVNSISILILNNNRIRVMDTPCFENLKNLTELKLNRNRISRIPKDLFSNQKQLKLLELNRNQLGAIEGLSFQPLEYLTVLKLKRNKITFLMDGAFFGLKHIGVLELDGNSLTKVSKGWLYGLESLTTLSLAGNLVSTIEQDGWECCQYLKDLDLSNNRLQEIGKYTFKHLAHLDKLNLNGNQISVIHDGAFNNTPRLQDLELSNNKISWTIEDMMGAFVGLRRLVGFSLGSNHVKSINRNAFVGLNNLTRLDLSNNNIIGIQENAFAAMPMLQDLVLNTSSLLCDCKLQWFSEWLKETKFISIDARCAYPLHLRGYSLIQLSRANFTCGDSPKPILLEGPEAKMTLKGENATLRCRARSSSPNTMLFKWKHDNQEIVSLLPSRQDKTEEGRQNEAISELQLFNLTHANAGKYQCIVENSFGTTYSSKAYISVLVYPSFTKIPKNMSVSAGETAKLECMAHGQPPPTIAWQKDEGHNFPAATERRMHMMPTDDVLFIINAKHEDTGVYSCTAQNLAGIIIANATLTVLERPSFSKPMENKDVMVGGTIVLQCMAGGMPRPTVSWSKDGGPLANTERHFFTAENQLLVIVNTKMSDAGTYECKLRNELGLERGYTQLMVMPAPASMVNEGDMLGVIIITVVCCAVATSIVWVVIIYQTRKRISLSALAAQQSLTTVVTGSGVAPSLTHAPTYTDNISEHSSCKDSGMGDSAKRCSDDFLPVEEPPSDKIGSGRVHMNEGLSSPEEPLLQHPPTPTVIRPTNHERSDTNSLH